MVEECFDSFVGKVQLSMCLWCKMALINALKNCRAFIEFDFSSKTTLQVCWFYFKYTLLRTMTFKRQLHIAVTKELPWHFNYNSQHCTFECCPHTSVFILVATVSYIISELWGSRRTDFTLGHLKHLKYSVVILYISFVFLRTIRIHADHPLIPF